MKILMITAFGGAAAVIALSGCATTNGTRPGDMTIPEHEQAAANEEQADDVEGGYEPPHASLSYDPDSRHLELAKEHARAADLRRAEVASVCDGVIMSTSLASMRVERFEAIREPLHVARMSIPEYLKGARLTLSMPPGNAAPPTTRSLQCEAARASAGLEPALAQSPLAVKTAEVALLPDRSKLVVEIRSTDSDDATEILRRAEAMAGGAASR
jgi:hypothetical protein